MKASKSYILDFHHKFLGLRYITSYWKRYIHSDMLFLCTKSDRLDTNFHTSSNCWLNVKSPCQDFNLELLRHTSEGWLFFFVPSCNLTVVSSSKHWLTTHIYCICNKQSFHLENSGRIMIWHLLGILEMKKIFYRKHEMMKYIILQAKSFVKLLLSFILK